LAVLLWFGHNHDTVIFRKESLMTEIGLAAFTIFIFFTLLVLALIYASRYQKVGPNI
jgi:hypothetical protein